MTADIKWEEPPPARPHSGASQPDPVLLAFSTALRQHPGRWARYPRHFKVDAGRATARNVKKGMTSNWQPTGAFEATTRMQDEECVVYVRYIGEAS